MHGFQMKISPFEVNIFVLNQGGLNECSTWQKIVDEEGVVAASKALSLHYPYN